MGLRTKRCDLRKNLPPRILAESRPQPRTTSATCFGRPICTESAESDTARLCRAAAASGADRDSTASKFQTVLTTFCTCQTTLQGRRVLFTVHAFLDQQGLIPVASTRSTHNSCVSGSTESHSRCSTRFCSQNRQYLIPVDDHPLRVSAHRRCVSAPIVAHSRC